jgi:hypothetical protein
MSKLDLIEVDRWLGQSGAEMNPSEMQFRAVPAKVWVSSREALESERACVGCIFKGQKSKVCIQAAQLARLSGQPDCEERDTETDKTFIYVIVPQDVRKLDLTKE